MRHRKIGRSLHRRTGQRIALFRSLMTSLVEHESIETTLPKAKELRRFAEPLITLAKNDTVANRRLAFARIRSKDAIHKLFDDLGPRCQSRMGGYLRILKIGYRQNDASPMAIIELIDKADSKVVKEPKKAKKKTKPKTEETKGSE